MTLPNKEINSHFFHSFDEMAEAALAHTELEKALNERLAQQQTTISQLQKELTAKSEQNDAMQEQLEGLTSDQERCKQEVEQVGFKWLSRLC